MPAKKRKYIRRRKVDTVQLCIRSTAVNVWITYKNRDGAISAKLYRNVTMSSIDRIRALANAMTKEH